MKMRGGDKNSKREVEIEFDVLLNLNLVAIDFNVIDAASPLHN